MNEHVFPKTLHSACPHDCPSTCALEVEVLDNRTIGRVRGASANTYTDGVICAKVARYAERASHPDRVLKPKIRKGRKGDGDWASISWEAALDLVAQRFEDIAEKHGSQSIWPYYYAGTMGLVQRDSIHRLRHAKHYSNQFDTICVNPAFTGYTAATGKLMGPDPREMAKSDCVVIWGTNAVSTQVNVMTHAVKARKQRGAKLVAIDIYMNDTMKQADLALCLRPGTDGALACAVMHCLFRDGKADRAYMEKYSDDPIALEEHLKPKTPQWASGITGLRVEEIEEFAQLIGRTPKTFFRLGYGFTRSRNGAVNMHAACCIATVMGAWKHEGGGAFHSNSGMYGFESGFIKGASLKDLSVRTMDQCKIGRALTGDREALQDGPPVMGLLIQNTNPVCIAPEQSLVKQGFAREDLFTVVHEQFPTETAEVADLVLPATMFTEHNDIYRGGGHQYIILGPKLVDAPGECRSNHYVIEELAKRLGVAGLPGFGKTENELIDDLLKRSNRGSLEEIQRDHWIDCQPSFEESHYLTGFAHDDGKFHFRADWTSVQNVRPPDSMGLQGDFVDAPQFPDHWDNIDKADDDFPFRLATSPSRSFLNTTFNRAPTSVKREGPPSVFLHPEDAQKLRVTDGDRVLLKNERGEVVLMARIFEGVQKGVVIAEGLHRNSAHEGGRGINTLISADAIAPHGGGTFHDTKVAIEKI